MQSFYNNILSFEKKIFLAVFLRTNDFSSYPGTLFFPVSLAFCIKLNFIKPDIVREGGQSPIARRIPFLQNRFIFIRQLADSSE